MHKLLLLSMVIATIVIPIIAARDPNPRRGLKKALFAIVVFAVVYLFALLFIYPKIFYPTN
jgi:hypothetical protein